MKTDCKVYRAAIITVRKSLEFNYTLIYRWAFLGEVADAIEGTEIWDVDIFDGAILNYHLDDYVSIIKSKYDLLLIYTDPHTSQEVKEIAEFCKYLSPNTKILVYGRATIFIPQYFERFPFDAVHIRGDREAVIKNYALFISGNLDFSDLSGLSIMCNGKFNRLNKGSLIDSKKWYYPTIDKLPIAEYKKHYKRKGRTFEYAISVSKGCKRHCKHCETWLDQGSIDRRRDPNDVLNWIETISDPDPWIVQLWSSNFFQSKEWVHDFCMQYKQNQCTFNWRAVGSFIDLDESLCSEISESGCIEIAFGVESLYANSNRLLKGNEKQLLESISLCKAHNINFKCLLMVGIPNQTLADLKYTIETLSDLKLPMRFSAYTPMNELRKTPIKKLDNMDLSKYDRRTYFGENQSIDKCTIVQAITKSYIGLLT